jgi:hypothetical protein
LHSAVFAGVNATARIHRSYQWRGCMAGHGARAASGTRAAYRSTHRARRGRFGFQRSHGGTARDTCGAWLDGRTQPSHRGPFCARSRRALPAAREGTYRPKAGCAFRNVWTAGGRVEKRERWRSIVFVGASDPIGAGLVSSLARPGGKVTGFLLYEASITGKWLGMLKEIAPSLERAAVIGNPKTVPFDYYLRAAPTPGRVFRTIHSRGRWSDVLRH